jgi:hypothetical protein
MTKSVYKIITTAVLLGLTACTTSTKTQIPTAEESHLLYLQTQIHKLEAQNKVLARQNQKLSLDYKVMQFAYKNSRENLVQSDAKFAEHANISEKVYEALLHDKYAKVVLARKKLDEKLKGFVLLTDPRLEYSNFTREFMEFCVIIDKDMQDAFPKTVRRNARLVIEEHRRCLDSLYQYEQKYVKPQNPLLIPPYLREQKQPPKLKSSDEDVGKKVLSFQIQ